MGILLGAAVISVGLIGLSGGFFTKQGRSGLQDLGLHTPGVTSRGKKSRRPETVLTLWDVGALSNPSLGDDQFTSLRRAAKAKSKVLNLNLGRFLATELNQVENPAEARASLIGSMNLLRGGHEFAEMYDGLKSERLKSLVAGSVGVRAETEGFVEDGYTFFRSLDPGRDKTSVFRALVRSEANHNGIEAALYRMETEEALTPGYQEEINAALLDLVLRERDLSDVELKVARGIISRLPVHNQKKFAAFMGVSR